MVWMAALYQSEATTCSGSSYMQCMNTYNGVVVSLSLKGLHHMYAQCHVKAILGTASSIEK